MRFLLYFAGLFLLSFAIACNNAAKPEFKKVEGTGAPAAKAPPSDGHDHAAEVNVPRITLADAKKEFDVGTAIFVDTRDTSTFNFARIKGAMNIQPASVAMSFDKIPKGKKIVVYCSWQDEHTSAGLVLSLQAKGISNVYALKGGTQVWMDAGFPMEGTKFADKK